MAVRVRFAPSPTGQVHIGNIRTAIFNWLFARHEKGEFLLRIEDTDLERSTQDAIDKLMDCMAWLGLDYDGEVMYQSRRSADHVVAATELKAKRFAYDGKPDESGRAPVYFRIPVAGDAGGAIRTVGPAERELDARETVKIAPDGVSFAGLSAKGSPMPMACCLAGVRELKLHAADGAELFDLESNLEAVLNGETFTVAGAAKMTFLRREVFYRDLIKGELSKPLDGVKDQIIVRSDGSPVFHLANVVDDIAQEVTHIIRGDDHVENTYRHILLFHALGAPIPQYGHLPMIVNAAGKPYSKRDGDAFVGDFRTRGFLAEALFNYLALLGWSPGDDREKLSKPEMIAAFTLDRVKSSAAQLDANKLLNLNGLYVAELAPETFVELGWKYFLPVAAELRVDRAEFAPVARFMQSRTKLFTQVAEYRYFFSDDYEFDAKNAPKFLGRPEVRKALLAVAAALDAAKSFAAEEVAAILTAVEAAEGFAHGKLFQPVRLAATGANGGAELDQTLALIGKERVVRRIRRALELFPERTA